MKTVKKTSRKFKADAFAKLIESEAKRLSEANLDALAGVSPLKKKIKKDILLDLGAALDRIETEDVVAALLIRDAIRKLKGLK